MKLYSPDYSNMSNRDAIKDFRARLAQYEKAYETLGSTQEEVHYAYVKVINVGAQVIANRMLSAVLQINHNHSPSIPLFMSLFILNL